MADSTMTKDANKLRRDMGNATEELRDNAARVGQDIRDLAGSASDVARDYYERGVDHVASMEEALEEYIRERPIRAALIAAGIGMFFGMMLRGRR